MAVIVNPNDPQNQQQNQPQGPNGQPLQTVGTAGPSGSGPSGTPMAQASANTLAQRQGSGRFTNLQKYLQANQGAGQRIAQQVGQNVNKNLSQQQQQAQKYYQQLGQTVSQAQQAAQQGAGFQQQLKGIGSDIAAAQQAGFDARNQQAQLGSLEQFVQNPEFQRFQDIQAGRGIDESLLGLQQQKAYQQALAAQQAAQQAQQSVGTESGRFELLRKAFGGSTRPGYSQGQQRLDQVLLGQGGGLGAVQADVASQLRASQEQARMAAEQGGEVSRLSAQERGLIGDIGTQAQSNEQAYMNMLQSYIDPLNTQRQKEFEGLGSAVGTYVPTLKDPATLKKGESPYQQKAWQPGFDADQMARLGLTDQNQGVYNVFKDEAFTQATGGTPEERNAALAKVIASQGRQAMGAQDVAGTQDVSRYQALAKILGMSPEQQRLTKESDIGAAWTAKGDAAEEGGLKGRLTRAEEAFREAAKDKTTGVGNYYAGQGRAKNMQDIIDKGIYAYESRDDTSPKWTNIADTMEGRASMGYGSDPRWGNKAIATNLYNDWIGLSKAGKFGTMSNQFDKFINEHNYGQTLGGKRETYLDTLRAENMQKQGITPKLDATPVTGVDPMLAYRASLQGLAKKGS